jgi:hypothetical protein
VKQLESKSTALSRAQITVAELEHELGALRVDAQWPSSSPSPMKAAVSRGVGSAATPSSARSARRPLSQALDLASGSHDVLTLSSLHSIRPVVQNTEVPPSQQVDTKVDLSFLHVLASLHQQVQGAVCLARYAIGFDLRCASA